ncbi:MAG: hypothetical protein FIA96_08045 [Betaproteobacteria bacterium]|nr:hypothetical protein [Betaproteobacteria bacterium]
MFDSPMEHCAVCGQMVTLDQTLLECQRRHECGTGEVCPLCKYFDDPERDTAAPPETPSIS